ncbi:hypothetical protein M885DRAFT_614254 [Pelagophyceae sp. CCMP2097]|nr:hypothetical protein M885DRAFT_614254 [Pelagophyceae sp. CCMP2097]
MRVAAGLAGLGLALLVRPGGGVSEEARVAEFLKRGGAWDPPPWTPETPGWRALMDRRESQLYAVEDSQERWDGWTTLVSSGLVVKNFTQSGFALADAPEHVISMLRAELHRGGDPQTAPPEEVARRQIDVIGGAGRPRFVSLPEGMAPGILDELQPLFEQWAGVELQPVVAYGLRVYQDGATLNMHVDKTEDHVISAILHVDHAEDSEPWPLVIEALDGSTVEVVLKRGQMMFYESAKCLHGRPRAFRGAFYSSLFIHYVPTDWDKNSLDAVYAVPPHWLDAGRPGAALKAPPPALALKGTGLFEPSCPPHNWCALDVPAAPPPSERRRAATARPESADADAGFADRGLFAPLLLVAFVLCLVARACGLFRRGAVLPTSLAPADLACSLIKVKVPILAPRVKEARD